VLDCIDLHGRNTAQWQRLRAARQLLDGYRCVICGRTDDLTVDLDEHLHGQHRGATPADCRPSAAPATPASARGSQRFRDVPYRTGRSDPARVLEQETVSEIAETTQPRELRNYQPDHHRNGEYAADAEFGRRLVRLAIAFACSLVVWGGISAALWMFLT
jgi:hypothetical protein